MSELYIYLGNLENTFFFIHSVHDKVKYAQIPYPLDSQIMNCMICESMIEDETKQCIVFTVNGDQIKATVITHADGPTKTYDTEHLSSVLARCVKAFANKKDHETCLIFQYDYEKDCFNTSEIPSDYTKKINFESMLTSDDQIVINDIIYYKTDKQI
jgi:hypothetical protein